MFLIARHFLLLLSLPFFSRESFSSPSFSFTPSFFRKQLGLFFGCFGVGGVVIRPERDQERNPQWTNMLQEKRRRRKREGKHFFEEWWPPAPLLLLCQWWWWLEGKHEYNNRNNNNNNQQQAWPLEPCWGLPFNCIYASAMKNLKRNLHRKKDERKKEGLLLLLLFLISIFSASFRQPHFE